MLKFHDNLSNLSENSVRWASNRWSFIPLNGDLLAGSEKAPALPNWKQFQHRHPSADERMVWFGRQGFHAAGIVLGKISGLVVIDIDDPDTAQLFAKALPDLTQTFTVHSGNRKLPHYYYAIDGQFDVPNIRTRQIELRSDGSYVVAPDVIIGGKVWRVVNDTQPRNLSQGDLSRLETFIRMFTQKPPQNAKTPDLRPSEPIFLTIPKLVNRYTHLASQIGRNNALFNCACYARDRGWTGEQVTDALMIAHIHHPPSAPTHETPQSRQREALRTVASVYQCPPRPVYHPDQPKQLPNTVREALLQRKNGFVARVLDGLFLAGARIGEWLSIPHVVKLLGGVIGRNTIYQALRMADIFNPQTPDAGADKSAENNIKQCLFDSGTNAVQNRRGRPSLYFQVPSFERLCTWLGVENRGSDPLTLDDVRTSTAYRRALYQAHIKRAPGAYTRTWQSQRLGVCQRTCRRYDRPCGIRVYPCYHETPILWDTLETAISDEPIGGRFIMDETGQRYPENRKLAQRLLGMGRRLSLMAQGANYYQVEPPTVTAQPTHTAHQPQPTAPIFAMTHNVIIGTPQPTLSAHLNAPKTRKPKRQKRNSQRPDGIPRPHIADRLYQTLRALDPDQSITKTTAKQWTKAFGEQAVYKALGVLEKRKNVVKNPAGFMRILLQQDSSVVLKKNDSTFQNRAQSIDSGAGWERFMTSKYASIFANYEDVSAGGQSE